VLRLIKLWLKAPIEEWDDGDGTRRIVVASNARGTPQGGVVIPLLANIYTNRFLKYGGLTGRGEAFRAHVIAYADDFVILSRGRATEALAWTKAVMTRLGLTLNEDDLVEECSARTLRLPRLLVQTSPLQSERSLVSEREPVQEERATAQDEGWQSAGAWQQRSMARSARHAEQLSALCLAGRTTSAMGRADRHSAALTDTFERVRDFLARRHKVAGRGAHRFSLDVVYGQHGLLRLERLPLTAAVCLTVKPVGEPDALIGHVRFDERGWETERCRMA